MLHYLKPAEVSYQLIMSKFIFSQYFFQQILKSINRLEKGGGTPHCLYRDSLILM